MFTKIISAKHVSHSFPCSDKDRTFEFWSFLIKVYQKCRRVFENFCSSKKKKNVCKGDVLLKHSVQDFG